MPTSLLGKAYRKEARKTTDSRKYLVLPQKAPAKKHSVCCRTDPAQAREKDYKRFGVKVL